MFECDTSVCHSGRWVTSLQVGLLTCVCVFLVCVCVCVSETARHANSQFRFHNFTIRSNMQMVSNAGRWVAGSPVCVCVCVTSYIQSTFTHCKFTTTDHHAAVCIGVFVRLVVVEVTLLLHSYISYKWRVIFTSWIVSVTPKPPRKRWEVRGHSIHAAEATTGKYQLVCACEMKPRKASRELVNVGPLTSALEANPHTIASPAWFPISELFRGIRPPPVEHPGDETRKAFVNLSPLRTSQNPPTSTTIPLRAQQPKT